MISLLLSTLKSDSFFIVIVTAFIYLTSLPCPWFHRPPPTFVIVSKIIAFLITLTAIFIFARGLDNNMASLKERFQNLVMVFYFIQNVVLLTYQLRRGEEMRDILSMLQEVRMGSEDQSCINKTTRAAIITLTFMIVSMFSVMIILNRLFVLPLFYLNVLKMTLVCEWAVAVSLVTHGLSEIKRVMNRSIGQAQTRQQQEHFVSVSLHMFRLYKHTFRRINVYFSYMLLTITGCSALTIIRQLNTLLKINFIGETYEGQTLLSCALLMESSVTIFIVCILSYRVQLQVDNYKYTVDKVLTFDPPKYIRQHLKVFLDEVNVSNFSISPFGLCTINLPLVNGIIGMVISFVIVMAQAREIDVL